MKLPKAKAGKSAWSSRIWKDCVANVMALALSGVSMSIATGAAATKARSTRAYCSGAFHPPSTSSSTGRISSGSKSPTMATVPPLAPWNAAWKARASSTVTAVSRSICSSRVGT